MLPDQPIHPGDDVEGEMKVQTLPMTEQLLPCPLCQSANVGVGICYVHGSTVKEGAVRCVDCGCRATRVAWQSRKARTSPVSARVTIQPMRLSDGRTDYFVQIKVGDRAVTPHVFHEEYKAAYHVALYDWLLNGSGEEPCPVDFGPDDWPARKSDLAQQAKQRIAAPNNDQLSKLWNAIVENTKGDGFWIGEILLTTLEREVGFNPVALADTSTDRTEK